jgi:ketosteroid isomerase-like protein
METISPEQVRAQIDRFWKILSGKSQGSLEPFYAAGATAFTGRSKRAELAALAAARRMRRLAAAESELVAELVEVEVQVLENTAIASYTYQVHSINKKTDGSRLDKNTRFGRATQIFQQDGKGGLHIVHEHLSAGEAPEVEALLGVREAKPTGSLVRNPERSEGSFR